MSVKDTYQSRKNLLASNLTAQGVTASGTEGLTSLINKVLDISPATITLATNKNILSYYDSETATLTATHSGGAGYTVEVYNAVTGTKIGDMTDNHDGTYSYTYNSQGIGDISIKATSGIVESNNISIEDNYIYRGEEYSYVRTSSNTTNTPFDPNVSLTLPTDCEITFECKCTGGTSSNEHRFFLQPNSLYVANSQPSYAIYWQNTGGSNGQFGYRNTSSQGGSNFTFPVDTYVSFKIVKHGTSIVCYANDTQYNSWNLGFLNNYSDWNIYFHLWSIGTGWIKNIKIKAIPSQ